MKTLRDTVAAEGEAIAPALSATPGAEVLAPLVTAAAGDGQEAAERALVMEAVLEGYLLHFGRTRLLETDDADLRLLAGDYMYALGLSRLAALGDLDAVRVLADLITASARHHAAAETDGAELGGAWVEAAMTVAGGRQAAMELEAQHALIAFRDVASTESRT